MNNKDAINLFLAKENSELQGKRRYNLWLLTCIFFLAVLGIGFGSASLKYLQYKMEDPFINWVDIIAQQKTDKVETVPLQDFLKDTNVQKQYNFIDPQPNYVASLFFRHNVKNKDIQLEGRTIKAGSSVLEKILNDENTICKRRLPYGDKELGIIITQEALVRLGYDTDKTPHFVSISKSADQSACEDVGLGDGLNGFYPISFPIVAVVKQLPGMYSFLFTTRFWNDMHSNTSNWDITEEENIHQLHLVGNEDALQTVKTQLQSKSINYEESTFNESFESLNMITIDNIQDSIRFFNQLSKQFCTSDIHRIYRFTPVINYYASEPSYYSIQMLSLDSIRVFQEELFEKCGIKLDMTSVEAKENFMFVQQMGNILSYCVIVLAVIFICVFIYFLLNTHFQKIQRNIGTFKAFGVSNKVLNYIYVRLLLQMILIAFALSIAIAFLLTLLLNQFTQIEDAFVWIDIFVWQNALLLGLSLLASIIATFFVSYGLLKHTPGDLIYNRN